MDKTFGLILALMTGVLIGAIFFGGLWWTIQKGLLSRWMALWFTGSLLLRTGIALAGFYWVTDGRWERLLACLGGFLIARLIVIRLTRTITFATQEGSHAPDSR